MMVIGGLFIYLGGGEIKLCEWIVACMYSPLCMCKSPGCMGLLEEQNTEEIMLDCCLVALAIWLCVSSFQETNKRLATQGEEWAAGSKMIHGYGASKDRTYTP